MFANAIRRLKLIRHPLLLLLLIAAPCQLLAQTLPTEKKLVPDKADQVKAVAKFNEAYVTALKRADSDKSYRLQFADFLFDEALRRTDPAEKYVWLKKAAETAAWAGDTSLALQAADELQQHYLTNTDGLKVEVFKQAMVHTENATEAKSLVELLMRHMALALEDDRFDVAEQLGLIALDAAKKSKDLPLVLSVRRETKGIADARQMFSRIQPFYERLKKDPRDETAHLQVGKYLCMIRGDWKRGLYYLAQCSDRTLRLQAQRDLIDPKDPARQTEIGDNWWKYSLKVKGRESIHIKQRAVHWYEHSVHAATGDMRKRLEARIDSIPAARFSGVIPWDHTGPAGPIRVLGRHNSTVYSVAFSPDGKTALSGSTDTRGAVWDTNSGTRLHHLQGHGGMIWNVAYAADGKHFFTASWDGSVKMWDTKTGREKRRFPAAGRIADVNGIAVSSDGRKLMAGSDDSSIRIWNINSGKLLKQLHGHRGFVYAVAFSPNGRRALSGGGSDRTLNYWNLQTGKIISSFSIPGSIRSVAFNPDGRTAVAAGEVAVRLWNLTTGKEIRRFQGHTSTVYGVAFSPDGKRLVTGGADRTVRCWDVATGKQLHVFTGHTSTIYSVAVSPGGGRAVSAGGDNTVRLWGLPRR